MTGEVAELIVEFYASLFDEIFSRQFRADIKQPLRRREVIRRVEEAADAASQSLTRLFTNEKVGPRRAELILAGLGPLSTVLDLERISSAVTPDALLEEVLPLLPVPEGLENEAEATLYRVSLHTTLQVLLRLGPVMAEWRKLKFSTTYELPQRVINRLNEINSRFVPAGSSAEDRRYEETYRDYIISRLNQTGVGTVKMTTRMDVDVRELFVMPRVVVQTAVTGGKEDRQAAAEFLDLGAARERFERAGGDEGGVSLLDHALKSQRCVIVGTPGSGKSTFFEWLQLQLAYVDVELVMEGEQAIPLLVRVRAINPEKLPAGQALLEHALSSKDYAALAPHRWLERQMDAGRVVFMLDGLDEISPEVRDLRLGPWLLALCERYPKCRYLLSSRPVGYPPGLLRALGFAECSLLDFNKAQVAEYAKHWCTAVRLARNESQDEARREGEVDGNAIVAGFENHTYISDLARNPLMLSAICLVNYFENGKLPDDRAVLYGMCVEGLLHNWDHRRGIHSEFGLDEKLRLCREVALEMQASNRAEFESERVQSAFSELLKDTSKADRLLEHIRYRTGLLIERRTNVYAFAHLTFQEYLAALAIARGNRLGFTIEQVIREHNDPRWREVIPLYCGLVELGLARHAIELLLQEPDSEAIAGILADSFFASGGQIVSDRALRLSVISRIARAPQQTSAVLRRFADEEVAPIANMSLGIVSDGWLSEAFAWLRDQESSLLDETLVRTASERLDELSPFQACEFVFLGHLWGSAALLNLLSGRRAVYERLGPDFRVGERYSSQADVAILALSVRKDPFSRASLLAWNMALDVVLSRTEPPRSDACLHLIINGSVPDDRVLRAKLAKLAVLGRRAADQDPAFQSWLAKLEAGTTPTGEGEQDA